MSQKLKQLKRILLEYHHPDRIHNQQPLQAHDISEYLVIVTFGTLVYVIFQFMTHWYAKRYSKLYQSLSRPLQYDYVSRVLSFINCVVSLVFLFPTVYRRWDEYYHDPFNTYTEDTRFWMAIMVGYFISDTWLIYKIEGGVLNALKRFPMVFHHFASIVFPIICEYYQTLVFFQAGGGIIEISGLFLNARWFYEAANDTGLAYKIYSLIFAISFLIVRIPYGFFLLYRVFVYEYPILVKFLPFSVYALLLAMTIGFSFIQFLWSGAIIYKLIEFATIEDAEAIAKELQEKKKVKTD